MKEEKENGGMDQARAHLDSIVELIDAYEKALGEGEAELDGDILTAEKIEQRIQETPLEISVRSGWSCPGKLEAEEYMILLCTGRPAVRIIGTLDQYLEPENASIQGQDWFTKWETLHTNWGEEERIQRFASFFCFSE